MPPSGQTFCDFMHALDICFDIASKMKNPHEVLGSIGYNMKEGQSRASDWPLISLAGGLTGIAYFYATMDLNFPAEGWEEVVRNYLLAAKDVVEQNSISDLSLYSGLTGLSATVHIASHNGSRYHSMLGTLDELLSREVQREYLSQTNHYLNPQTPIPPNHYNLANGLSGILLYFMYREDNVILKNLAQDCLNSLVEILSTIKEINGSQVPAWYVSSEHESISEYKGKYPKGYFKLDIPYGLPGVMAALSMAKIKGYQAPGLMDLIAKMSHWILKKQIVQEKEMNWNHIVSVDEELDGIVVDSRIRNRSWFHGALGVLRCLLLSAKAVNDQHLAELFEKAFLSHIMKPNRKNEVRDSSFSFGNSGLLAMTHDIACETKNPDFFKQAFLLEEGIKNDHHPNHAFGFQTLLIEDHIFVKRSHDPTLLSGAAGIALTLLRVHCQHEAQRNPLFG